VTRYEHLDLLRAQIELHVPVVGVPLAPDAQILHVFLRGGPEQYVVWSHQAAAYEWFGGPDAGAQLGADAIQAVKQVERALLPSS
jgi:hypothetical protein